MEKKRRFDNPLLGSRQSDANSVKKIRENTDRINSALDIVIESGDSMAVKVLMIIRDMQTQDEDRDVICANVTNAIYKSINELAVDVSEIKDRQTAKYFFARIKIFDEGIRSLINIGMLLLFLFSTGLWAKLAPFFNQTLPG